MFCFIFCFMYILKTVKDVLISSVYLLLAKFTGMADVEQYAAQLKEIGVEYVGFCCGNSASYTRALAMAFGRHPPAEKYAISIPTFYKFKSI